MHPLAGLILADQPPDVLIDLADFERVSQYKWHISSNGYVTGWVKEGGKPKKVLLHRFLLQPRPEEIVDHANLNRLDNRRINLRLCTKSQNAVNTLRRKTNTSGFNGVSWNKAHKKWEANIRNNTTRHFLGYFPSPDSAYAVYAKAAKEIHGDFART